MLAAVVQTATGKAVSATIDASKTGAAISPDVYGQLVEHAGSLVYTGLWSEMVAVRAGLNLPRCSIHIYKFASETMRTRWQ